MTHCTLCNIPIIGEPYRRDRHVYCCEACALAERELTLCRFQLDDAFLATIRALAAAIEARDPYTAGHTQRVTAYTLAIGRALKLTPQELDCVERGSTLHDVGKIGVPDAVLRKPGLLTSEEWAQMKQHPEIGYQILKKVGHLADSLSCIRYHHERFDGTGYPLGLRGQEIPLDARIMAVADALDAMITDRPYRPARSFAAAREEIVRGAGTQFDPEVVEAFMGVTDQELMEHRHAAVVHSVYL